MWTNRKEWHDLTTRLADLERKLGHSEELQLQIETLRREVQNFHLDYNNLYEKVRTNLAKLRKRSDEPVEQPDVAQGWREALLRKKMGG